MVNYLHVAERIHGWLTGLQISQKFVQAAAPDNRLVFTFQHPEKGSINVIEEFPRDRVFRVGGVAFETAEKKGAEATLRVYDFGGIWDPVDERVMGEHYSTSHFALLSAVLYNQSHDREYLEQAKQAFEFHLHTSPEEYAFSDWMYHWDFQNYALIECYARLKEQLDGETRKSWERYLRNWTTNQKNPLSNWAAMRALAYLQRYKMFDSSADWLMSQYNLFLALKGEQKDGCFDDEKNVSRPIQYHIYTAALLHRMFLLNGSQRLARKFLQGVEFFMPFIDPDGDFNYWGRGHGQIFGYGAAIYVLTAAAKLTSNKKYQQVARKVFDYLMRFECNDHFPLVLNDHADEERMGWYDYHHTTVYNAFLGVWLALAYELEKHDRKNFAIKKAEPVSIKHPNFAFLSNSNFYIAVGKGMPRYSSEAGASPCHIWVKNIGWLFSAPGGPTPDRFGKRTADPNILKNLIAPIIFTQDNKWITPVGMKNEILNWSKNKIVCSADYQVCQIGRHINLQKDRFEIHDEIAFTEDIACREFRLFNFPIVIDKFNFEAEGKRVRLDFNDGSLFLLCEVEPCAKKLEALETLRTVKGLAQVVAMRLVDVHIKKGEIYSVKITGHLDSENIRLAAKQTAAYQNVEA
jgi:hypothetical protein